MKLALAIASFVVLIIHGVVLYDQFFYDWQDHQDGYFGQVRTQATSEQERAEMAARRPRVEQILVTQFGDSRVDRCTTCHIAIDDPRFSEHFEPLKTHPVSAALGDVQTEGRLERRHKFAEFGCTVCHGGQGRGLEEYYAHGEDHYWPEPLAGFVTQETWKEEYEEHLLGPEYMEANCAQCHTEEAFAGAPTLARGRELFFDKNCYGCHRIEGLADGTLGPDLSEVGHVFKVDYLWEAIVDPRSNSATSVMPKFKLTDDEVKALVIFLSSRRGMNFAETSLDRYRARLGEPAPAVSEPVIAPSELAPEELTALGERLVDERACLACHKLGAEDGEIAPDLTHEGLIRDNQWVLDHFRNPRDLVADSIMPTFRFRDGAFEAMTAYLASLATQPEPLDGKASFEAYCQRCHGEEGDGHGMIAIYLDPYPRDLTKSAFMRSKPAERFHEAIRKGVAGTSMPPFERVMSEEQIQATLDYVLETFTKGKPRTLPERNLPATNPVAADDASIARGDGVYRARCTGCHGLKADGKGPNSLDILPRPRNLRNDAFVDSVDDRRMFQSILYGIQGTAMPPWIDYGLSQEDCGDLVNYIRSLN